MEDGLVSLTEEGMPQGGTLSPVLSNVYLGKLNKELEGRGLSFVRYSTSLCAGSYSAENRRGSGFQLHLRAV